MGFDGSGGYTRVHNWVSDKNAGIKIVASRHDAEDDDFASAFTLCLTKDGQQDPTANLPMASKKHTGVAVASARTEYVDLGSYQDGKFVWAGLASGTSAIALTLNPTITAYTTGMKIGFIAVGDNASAVTVNVDGVSAAAGVKGKNEALVATDIVSGGAYWITYKGADGFQFGNPLEENPTFITLTTTGLATLGNVLCSGSAVFTSSLNVTGAVSVAGTLTHADNVYPASAGLADDIIITDGAGGLAFGQLDDLWTYTGSIDLTSGSPTSVALVTSLSNVSEIEIYIDSWSSNTANQAPLIQIGDSGGLETSGYTGKGWRTSGDTNHGAGFFIGDNGIDAADAVICRIVLSHMGSNVWSLQGVGFETFNNISLGACGLKTLTGALDRVFLTTFGGTATFDGGTAFVRSR